MENKQKFRIVNKTNKTVTVKIGPESHTMTWDEYNQSFVTVDKFWAVFNEELEKMSKEMDEDASTLTVFVMEMNAAKSRGDASGELKAMYRIGVLMDEMEKKFNLTPAQIMQLVKKNLMVLNPFMVNPMFPVSNSQKKFRRKMERKAEEEVSRPVPVVDEKKPTLGDAFSCLGELKEKMENK